ncbi:MAG: GNAT family N-acetyltransferase [Natronospirillum sp.]|uniref:GNAT family N-acetyltransferase n=1 Tax=Natronospirillum sp. TaxID=2812955 RepID=UPI0025CEA509|nr:GNAT family N-acetyltransferase [Natronospirillum sp.]MCH8551415.1 GNAT family N-acetyltransferase [Natronospirillum sp.]
MTVHIIPLADRIEFVRELAELHHSEWGHFNPSFTLDMRAEAIEKAARREGIPSVFIAVKEGELIGSAALIELDMKTRPDLYPWLAAVYVKEKFRHQGIASALIARCETEAAQSGVTQWYLFTESAADLYRKLGWQHFEQCDYKGATVDIMVKDISPGC